MGAHAELTKMRQGTKTRYFIGVSFKAFEKKETFKPKKEKCFSASIQNKEKGERNREKLQSFKIFRSSRLFAYELLIIGI